MIKILHVITGSSTGGAEMMLYKLLSQIDRDTYENEVISLTTIGAVGEKIRDLGIRVSCLGMTRGTPNPIALLKLVKLIRKISPQVIQTWMYHADLLGGLAAKLAGGIPLAWNIRHSALLPGVTKKSTIWTAKICALLSGRVPARIVCCSHETKRIHSQIGYDSDKMVIIPNGFQLETFCASEEMRISVRRELGVGEKTVLVGLVARYDPQKGHRDFVQSAAQLSRVFPEVHFLLCGDGVTWENTDLTRQIDSLCSRSKFHLLGRRSDIERITAALDVASLTSYTEGFPNVVGEAMACEVPCVVTDVGDAGYIVGDTGLIVPPGNAGALAEAWTKMLLMVQDKRIELGAAARRRIKENFSLPIVVGKYEKLYQQMLQGSVSIDKF